MSKVISIYAYELHAGDLIVIKVGSIRKSYRICELGIAGRHVDVIYNGQNGIRTKLLLDINDVVKIRE